MDERRCLHRVNSKRALPNTPRVSGKIKEYYEKFGHDRDLEKFMRIYSPASSQDSQKTQKDSVVLVGDIDMESSCCVRTHSGTETTLSTASSCEALAKMPSRPLSVCCMANSKSLPNIDVQGQNVSDEHFAAKDVIVDINIEMEGGNKEKILSVSNENIQTPKKILKDVRTQTPESIAKSHRRLEWDSLGDVGYKKSMSTSNISVMERSLLKEFFKESSVTSEPCTSQQAKEKEMQQKQMEHKIIKSIKTTEIEHSTPPLACSTLVEGYRERSTKRGAKPKMISQYTSSTSLQEKFEKYAQTSLIKPSNVHSREIQCTMSSSNSVIEGTATPSSFEYYSSRSSKSSESRKQVTTKSSEHPFITSITELLMKRKVLCEKNQQKRLQLDNIRELQTKFQNALDENKENQSHSTTASSTATNTNTTTSFSLTKQAPELDLGIQLICSLIDAKSVNGRQKKQLIRDIVKRITRLETGDISKSTTNSSGATTNSNKSNSNRNFYDSVHSNSNTAMNNNNKGLSGSKPVSGALSNKLVTSEVGISPIYTQVPFEKSSRSSSLAKEKIHKVTDSKPLKEDIKLKTLQTSQKFQVQTQKNHDKHFPCKSIPFENVLKENNKKVTNVQSTTNKNIQSYPFVKKRTITPTEVKDLENKSNKYTQTSRSSKNSDSTSTKPSSSSSSSTQDLITQKCVNANKDLNNSNTDAEQPTMREWLNPLTQSEIEYEERKKEEIKKKETELKREKHLKKSSKYESGRMEQLNWIDNEIQRLECLKHLLLKDETNIEQSSTTLSSTEWASRRENRTKDSTQTDKLYDTVYSDKSSVLSESAELIVKEIEVILEESNEDVINLKDNLKRTKERKKEIQIFYEKPKVDPINTEPVDSKYKPKFRTMKETTTINEEQLLSRKNSGEAETRPRKQREKIDTPSTENSQESETLRDLVQHRKREFMEAYKTKKQHHYEALKQQQQKEEFKYLNIQIKMNEKSPPLITDPNHYSVPHTMTRKIVYKDHPLPSSPALEDIKTKTIPKSQAPVPDAIIYSTPASFQHTNNNHKESNKAEDSTTAATTTTPTATTSSSTSLFCISSDVSVPMGSQLTSSTPTTTHQYDDVAAAVAGVAVQTSDSVLRSKPIYGPRRPTNRVKSYATTTSTTACIQVKPKGIAYVIEFDNNKNSKPNSNIISIANDNSNSKVNVENNSLPTEPSLTLQDHLEKAKPEFVQHSKERKAILNQLQSMRQARDRKLREIIDNASNNSLERHLEYLPPPPIQKVRILNTKQMKALTNKRFANLPEVVARKEREVEEKKRRSNRILRDIFNRRLQKNVLNGKLSLNHSKVVV